MIDVITQKPLKVDIAEGAPSLLILPESQLEQVKTLLDTNQVRYWVHEEYLSTDGEPEVPFINISRNSDPHLVQRLLDSAGR
jgi:hypothetical protein